jgi:cytochrome c-type biogenesis protein CcmE
MTPEKRRRLTIGGLVVIAYALISAVYMYYRDRYSMDYFAMGYAMKGAVVHAVLFGLVGLGMIAWANQRE